MRTFSVLVAVFAGFLWVPSARADSVTGEVVAECAGMFPEAINVGVDGCGAPNFAMPMRNGSIAGAEI